MSLKSRTVCNQEVEYGDLEDFVKEKFGREWSFVAAGEYGNDEQHSFTTSKHPLDVTETAEVQKFIDNGEGYPHPSIVLNWLSERGHITPGNYLINVFW
jgi:hypothetical protein